MTLTAEPPVATAPASAPTAPAAPAPTLVATAAPETLNVETFLRDSATQVPDALLGLTPAHKPSELLTRGRAPKPSAPTLTVPETVVPAPAVTPVTPAPVAAEPVAAAAPAPSPAPAPTAAEHAKNWRVQAKDAKEALVLQLVKGGTPMQDAYLEVYGAPAASPAAAPAASAATISEAAPAPAPNPLAGPDAAIAKLESSVAEFEKQIEEAAEKGDTPAALRLVRQQADVKISLANAKTTREATARQIEDQAINQAVADHRQLESASKAEILKLYPALADPASEHRAAFNLMAAEMQKKYGADFMSKNPGWPELVANAVAVKERWNVPAATPAPVVAPAPAAPAASPASTPMNQPSTSPLAPQQITAPSLVAPVRAISAELITGSNSPGAATPVLDKGSFWRESGNVEPSALLDLMRYAPTPAFLLRNQNKDPRRLGAA